MKTATIGSFLVLLLAACPALAGISLDLSDPYDLDRDSATTSIDLHITGDISVSGLELYLEVGNGDGPHPRIVDIETKLPQMVFEPRGDVTTWGDLEDKSGGAGQKVAFGLALLSTGDPNDHPSRVANGKLCTITFDTTAVPLGTWELTLGFEHEGNQFSTTFIDPEGVYIPAGEITLSNGSVTIVPEPSTLALLAAVLAGAPLLIWYRKRRS